MLDFGRHQGSSLLGAQAADDSLRLVPMVANGDEQSVMWDVCQHWQRLGYPTLVLDGCSVETAAEPGLAELLEHSLWIDGGSDRTADPVSSVAVIPAARGLETLKATAGALHALYPLFRRFAVVVLYAPLDVLAAPLLANSGAVPLLVMKSGSAGVIEGYQQLKALALHAGVNALVAGNVTPDVKAAAVHSQLQRLCACAHDHLRRTPRTMAVNPHHPADLQRLALALLEGAATIASSGSQTAALPWTFTAAQSAAPLSSH